MKQTPPWLLPSMAIICDVPGINKKSDLTASLLQQLTSSYLTDTYPTTEKIYTDGSCTPQESASAVYGDNISIAFRLPRPSSSTTAGLAQCGAWRRVSRHYESTNPREALQCSYSICSDSKPARQGLSSPDMDNYLHYRIYNLHAEITS